MLYIHVIFCTCLSTHAGKGGRENVGDNYPREREIERKRERERER